MPVSIHGTIGRIGGGRSALHLLGRLKRNDSGSLLTFCWQAAPLRLERGMPTLRRGAACIEHFGWPAPVLFDGRHQSRDMETCERAREAAR